MMLLNWRSIIRTLEKYNEQFNAWTDKFTDNSMFAIALTVLMFFLSLAIIKILTNKRK